MIADMTLNTMLDRIVDRRIEIGDLKTAIGIKWLESARRTENVDELETLQKQTEVIFKTI